MKKIALILFALFTMLGSARAQSSGEYKAFVYNRPTGCIGQTTEEGLVPDCYDATQNWARYTWSYGLKHYVPANQPLLTVAKLPTATDISSFPAFAVVSDSLNACVAGNTLTGGGTFVCPVFNNGVSWQLLGLTGGGGSGVTIVNAGADITVTGPTSSPVVNVANSGVAAGTYTVSTITVNAQGIITSASSGSVGSVTSVGLTMPTGFSVAGSPVTSSGTLAVTFATEAKNTVLAGPTDGSAATPTFRLLGAYDVPGQVVNIANASSTGTTLNKLVKLTGAPSTVVINNTADTSGAIGICIQDCGTTGTASIQQNGATPCVFDGATTAGDYVQISSTVNGDCHDAGATYPIANGEVLGTVTTTNGSGGTYNINLFTPDVVSTNGGGKVQCASLPSFTGDISNVNCAVTVKAVQGNPLAPNRVTTSGATLSVNLSTSLNQFITLHDTITLSFSAAPADGNIVRFKLTQSNGGSHTVTWPGTVQWPGAAAPTLTTTNGQADFIQCLYDATTTNYDCSSVLNYTP